MKWMGILAGVFASLSLAGCGRVQEALLSVPDKVNAAYPVAPDVQVSRDRLEGLLQKDKEALSELSRTSDTQMTMRALACSKGRTVGRFDSLEAVKALSLDRTCFQQQDDELMQLYGLRTVGVLLSQAPLRAKQPIGAPKLLPAGDLSSVDAFAVARDANVAVVLDGRGRGAVLDLIKNEPISTLAAQGAVSENGIHLSPNGRIVVLSPNGRPAVFLDAETGHQIWVGRTQNANRMMEWLPELGAWLMSDADGGLHLVDSVRGTISRHPHATKRIDFALRLPGEQSHVVMGSMRQLVRVAHRRTDGALTTEQVREYTLVDGSFWRGAPVLMRSGRLLVFSARGDLAWLDLQTAESGIWRTSPAFGGGFAKLDERTVLLDAASLPERPAGGWRFDIERGTVTPVRSSPQQGHLRPIGAREGFVRRSHEAWIADAVETNVGAPTRLLSEMVAEYDLQRQLAKLEAMAREESVSPSAAAGAPAFSFGEGVRPPAAEAPVLRGLPADAEVHIVGVYEGASRSQGGASPMSRTKQPVRVMVRPSARPLVLVLASYEPVNWVIANAGARIAAVLVSGYHPSTVVGQVEAQVLRIGSDYAYSASGAEYARLRGAVTRYVGPRDIKSFQGSYKGESFTIGGSGY